MRICRWHIISERVLQAKLKFARVEAIREACKDCPNEKRADVAEKAMCRMRYKIEQQRRVIIALQKKHRHDRQPPPPGPPPANQTLKEDSGKRRIINKPEPPANKEEKGCFDIVTILVFVFVTLVLVSLFGWMIATANGVGSPIM